MSELAPMMAPAARPSTTSDPDEFQLPMSGLFADLELGRGSVQLPDDFQLSSSLAKLLVLRDWQRSISRYRHEALHQFEQELSRGQPDLSHAERVRLLKSTCDSLRIELPGEFEMSAATT
jgi:hypothetical protein